MNANLNAQRRQMADEAEALRLAERQRMINDGTLPTTQERITHGVMSFGIGYIVAKGLMSILGRR